jgi:hypothetical protein
VRWKRGGDLRLFQDEHKEELGIQLELVVNAVVKNLDVRGQRKTS